MKLLLAVLLASLVASCGASWPSTCELRDGIRRCKCAPTRIIISRHQGLVTVTCTTPRGEEPVPWRAEGPVVGGGGEP